MNKLNTAVAAGLLALASEGCVVEHGATSTGGRYNDADTGYNDGGYHHEDANYSDSGVHGDTGGGARECQNNYSGEIQRVLHGFMDRTNDRDLQELIGLSQPVLEFTANYDTTPYYIQPETPETGHLIRGGVDFNNDQVAVGVADYDNYSEEYSDRQFLELAYDGQVPFAARTYVEHGPVMAGTAYDLMVQIEQRDDLGGDCEVALKDGYNNALDEQVLCENPCEALLEALSGRAVSVINQ